MEKEIKSEPWWKEEIEAGSPHFCNSVYQHVLRCENCQLTIKSYLAAKESRARLAAKRKVGKVD